MADDFKRTKDRSPNYPGLALDQALERVSRLHGQQGRHSAPADVAIRNMGLSPRSGNGLGALAAVKSYGLVDDRGRGSSRLVGLSELGLRLVLPDNPNRAVDLRRAALNPPIYKEMWEAFGPDLPDDGTLGWRLREKHFSESGIAEFIPRFRRTMSLLEPHEGASLDADEAPDEEEVPPPPDQKGPISKAFKGSGMSTDGGSATAELMVIPIPLGADGSAALQVPTRMSRAAWTAMKAIIDAYERIVVAPPVSRDEETEEG